jgi:hypothetical protein
MLFERQLQASPKFRGGLARECHRGELVDAVCAARDARCHPPRHAVRLARSRSGLDEKRAIDLALDPAAGRLIPWCLTHTVGGGDVDRALGCRDR